MQKVGNILSNHTFLETSIAVIYSIFGLKFTLNHFWISWRPEYLTIKFHCLNVGITCRNKDDCCTEERPCGLSEGTCRRDAHCRDGLKCGRSGCHGDGTCCNERSKLINHCFSKQALMGNLIKEICEYFLLNHSFRSIYHFQSVARNWT